MSCGEKGEGREMERSSSRSRACTAGARPSAYRIHVSADELVSCPAARKVEIWQRISFADICCDGTSEMFERTGDDVSDFVYWMWKRR